MLYFSLIVSSVFLILANLLVWKAKQPLSQIMAISIVVALFSFCSGLIFLPPLLLQAILLGVLVSVWTFRHWRRRTFALLSCAVTLAVYGVLSVIAFQDTMHLQREFAYVSLKDRLPSSAASRPVSPLPPETANRLAEWEDRLKDHRAWMSHHRTEFLRAIHEETVQVFVNQQGFGVGRMSGMERALLRGSLYQQSPIPQPGTSSPSPWVSESLQSGPKPTDGLRSLHEESVLDFANPVGFGFIKDRQHVAGFQEHRIGQLPAPPERWKLQTLDLVGLVVHKEPTAYLSEHLPRMDELRRLQRARWTSLKPPVCPPFNAATISSSATEGKNVACSVPFAPLGNASPATTASAATYSAPSPTR